MTKTKHIQSGNEGFILRMSKESAEANFPGGEPEGVVEIQLDERVYRVPPDKVEQFKSDAARVERGR
jgi:hypothetical protein